MKKLINLDYSTVELNILSKLEEFGRNHEELNKAIGLRFDPRSYRAIIWNFNGSENADIC